MNKKGVWVSPTEFVNFADAPRSATLDQHIATRGRSSAGGFSGANLPNPDPILKALGKDITVYRDLRSAALVGGNVRRRKASVLSLERGIKRGDAPSRSSGLSAIGSPILILIALSASCSMRRCLVINPLN